MGDGSLHTRVSPCIRIGVMKDNFVVIGGVLDDLGLPWGLIVIIFQLMTRYWTP